ncbi:hypothetical protein [Natrinema sp. 1APR25-10V2]|uniref:hypothetical protein n=1 Tax=Natrinema sp. 1APR25-10V2 TaxID=2951081 RepID=UPI002875083E|nr:hypothetical protein [Natrinema sp. 1APR25-10V2]MDS0473669.1 hypothetical protein [Natrinema sp. 1APR25-10V2]
MGILDLMLGKSGPGEQGVEGKSYTLPKETHDFVYPVAVHREELEAFAELLEAEAAAPSLEEAGDLQAAFDGMVDGRSSDIDAGELAERMRRPRKATEPVIETWREGVERDIGVVYARTDTYDHLLAFVKLCKQRDEDDDDPFELPESFQRAAALLKRVEEASDSKYRAVVHTDILPGKKYSSH